MACPASADFWLEATPLVKCCSISGLEKGDLGGGPPPWRLVAGVGVALSPV